MVSMQVLRLVEVKHKMTSQFYITRIMPIGLFMALTPVTLATSCTCT